MSHAARELVRLVAQMERLPEEPDQVLERLPTRELLRTVARILRRRVQRRLRGEKT
jgi:hypothetical protein